ncbi:YihY/virulence factor BrkB family protein [Halorussus gelatinilyticus]|uniref:YihY/virulence factor BrkB family protein n=1 Tax=Halorussus gelatinilyticus TaxID=2937524 RepID=A0A8U0ILK6_9EURY|nr:YihY/virulence factor BrkB family protein [Halorussus gelatinilyticus]UPW01491.1 YihY/virulence factor BrkB family protein [Halorussus gelatinilyticus]
MPSLGNAVDVGRSVVEEAREQEITFLAASTAYYAFVSLIPLLLLAFVVVSFVAGEQFATQVVNRASGLLTATGEDQLRQFILNPQGQGGTTAIGLVLLAWSAIKVFRGFDEAFSAIYATDAKTGIADQVKDALLVLAAIGAGVVVVVLTGAATALFPQFPFVGVVTTLIQLVALVPVFLPLYVVFPDAGVSIREALPGAVVATVGWTILQVLFRIYAAASSTGPSQFLGTALLLVTWLYFASILVLLGGVVNVVLADRGSYAERTKESETDRIERKQRLLSRYMTDDESAPDIVELRDELRELRADVESFEEDIETRTVEKPEVESELKQYVRKRMRRGHARGWGPYLVLLYGTAMTLGAFFWLEEFWAIFAMSVVWLSTLGLYALMVMLGFGVGVLSLPGRVSDRIGNFRS